MIVHILLHSARIPNRLQLCFAFAIARFRLCQKRYFCRLACSREFVAPLSVCTGTTFLALSAIQHRQPLKHFWLLIVCTAQFWQFVPLVRAVFARVLLVILAYFLGYTLVCTYKTRETLFLVYQCNNKGNKANNNNNIICNKV